MTTEKTPGALVVGTRTADVEGNPNHTMLTGKPWRVVTCWACEREMWTSATARLVVASRGLRAVYLCEPCAGLGQGRPGDGIHQ